MQNTPQEIIRLAHAAGLSYGAHAFVVVQVTDNVQYAERGFPVTDGNVAAAKAGAEAQAEKRRADRPGSSFYVLEIGADRPEPASLALISRLASLLDGAISTHIYDEDNGDEIPDDCPYTAAVAEAEAFLATYPPAGPPVGLLEIAEALSDATEALDHQLNQVCQLHRYSDDETRAAMDEGDEARKRLDLFRKATAAGPLELFVTVEGGNVQDVFCERPTSGIKVTVIDYDVEDEDQAVVEIHQEGDRWEKARADEFAISVEPAPVMRDIQEDGE